MKTSGTFSIHILLFSLSAFPFWTTLHANTISFVDGLHPDLVTLSSSGTPTFVPGVGLGIDGGVGPAGEINTLFHYNAGQYVPSIIASESVTIGVNGLISSIIVSTTAYAREAGGDWHLLPLYPYDYPYNQPLELAFNTGDPYDAAAAWRPFIVDTGITRPFNVRDDEFINFLNYRQAHIDEAEDIMTGISVVSISYVPAVPDATSTAGLVAMCFAVLLCCKGRRLVMGAGPRP